MATSSNQPFPSEDIAQPFMVPKEGQSVTIQISPAWRQFFVALWNRTGGANAQTSIQLDQISTVEGATLYRGPNLWQALAPGPNGTVMTLAAGLPSWGSVSSVLDNLGSVAGDIIVRGASAWAALAQGTQNTVLVVGPSGPFWGQLSGLNFANQAAAQFLAGPASGPNSQPTFRSIVVTDRPNVAQQFSAAGSSQGTATQLTAEWSFIVGGSGGVVLFLPGVGIETKVFNLSGGTVSLYPPVGGQIDSLGPNNPYTLNNNKSQIFSQTTANQVYSTQLG